MFTHLLAVFFKYSKVTLRIQYVATKGRYGEHDF